MMRLRAFLILVASFYALSAPAQNMFAGEEYGLELGWVLPNQVHGLKEIMPVWGIHYGYSLGRALVELGGMTGNASGSQYNHFNLGLRGESDVGNLVAYYGGGPTWTYYTPKSTKDYVSVLGGYAELGALLPLSQEVFLNGNMRFSMSPGTALHLGVGFVIRLP